MTTPRDSVKYGQYDKVITDNTKLGGRRMDSLVSEPKTRHRQNQAPNRNRPGLLLLLPVPVAGEQTPARPTTGLFYPHTPGADARGPTPRPGATPGGWA